MTEDTVEKPTVEFTPAAQSAIALAVLSQGDGLGDYNLRVSVRGGGCSGYQYELSFEKDAREDDEVLSLGEVKVFIDSVSSGYLKGTVIDYESGLNGTGFKFINPNAKRTCGCGSSFS